MKWIGTETLKDDNYTYIDDYEKFIERVRRYDKGIFDEDMEIGREQEKYEIARKLKVKGMDTDSIDEITGLSLTDIGNLS